MLDAEMELAKWRGWKPNRHSKAMPPWPQPVSAQPAEWENWLKCGGCGKRIAWRVQSYELRWRRGVGALGRPGVYANVVCEKCIAEEALRT